eukprot:9322161-Pyramimonas_sp.AAC.1
MCPAAGGKSRRRASPVFWVAAVRRYGRPTRVTLRLCYGGRDGDGDDDVSAEDDDDDDDDGDDDDGGGCDGD